MIEIGSSFATKVFCAEYNVYLLEFNQALSNTFKKVNYIYCLRKISKYDIASQLPKTYDLVLINKIENWFFEFLPIFDNKTVFIINNLQQGNKLEILNNLSKTYNILPRIVYTSKGDFGIINLKGQTNS